MVKEPEQEQQHDEADEADDEFVPVDEALAAAANHFVAYGIVHPKKRKFLAAYAVTGNLTAAAKMSGTRRPNHYDWLGDSDEGEAYARAFAAAQDIAADILESEAWRRAVKGVEKPVYQQGKLAGKVREFSDVLLIFLLKGARPQKYRENISQNVHMSGKLGIEQVVVFASRTDEDDE